MIAFPTLTDAEFQADYLRMLSQDLSDEPKVLETATLAALGLNDPRELAAYHAELAFEKYPDGFICVVRRTKDPEIRHYLFGVLPPRYEGSRILYDLTGPTRTLVERYQRQKHPAPAGEQI